ncbi:MAG: DUF1361 domain-containing protein [Saprospiraceae bacterium]|nr:DUF1361 domain-containing protein [Saprospiraceae bacterium]
MTALRIPRYIKILLLFTIANLLILGIRNYIVGDTFFDFLKSNLLSGVMPFAIAVFIQIFDKKFNGFFFIALSLLWLLFYPNAPYMISDLIHPHEEAKDAVMSELIVHDTLIVFSIAMLSVFYGFVSLKIIFNLFNSRYGSKKAHAFIIFSLLLSCLGFYMGRELVSEIKMGNGYLYSSEMFMEPVYIIKTVWKAIWPIQDHLPAYYMMILFGFVQYQLLVMMKDVSDIEEAKIVTKD